jgi:hypothetical protein
MGGIIFTLLMVGEAISIEVAVAITLEVIATRFIKPSASRFQSNYKVVGDDFKAISVLSNRLKRP